MTEDEPTGRAKGGVARANALSPERRSEIARAAVAARWEKQASAEPEAIILTPEEAAAVDQEPIPAAGMPTAIHRGQLNIVGLEVPCYVLDNGVRVIGRTSATEVLTGIKGGGALEKYIAVRALEPFIS